MGDQISENRRGSSVYPVRVSLVADPLVQPVDPAPGRHAWTRGTVLREAKDALWKMGNQSKRMQDSMSEGDFLWSDQMNWSNIPWGTFWSVVGIIISLYIWGKTTRPIVVAMVKTCEGGNCGIFFDLQISNSGSCPAKNILPM